MPYTPHLPCQRQIRREILTLNINPPDTVSAEAGQFILALTNHTVEHRLGTNDSAEVPPLSMYRSLIPLTCASVELRCRIPPSSSLSTGSTSRLACTDRQSIIRSKISKEAEKILTRREPEPWPSTFNSRCPLSPPLPSQAYGPVNLQADTTPAGWYVGLPRTINVPSRI